MSEEENSHNLFLYVLLGGCILVILSSFYFFYFKKKFDFIIETNCNPETETCFHRDCTNPDDCPPNGFSNYNKYYLRASDFKACGINEDCTEACANGKIKCSKIECTENDLLDGNCVSPINLKTN